MSAVPGNLVALWLLEKNHDESHGSTSASERGWTESSPVFCGLSALCLMGALVLLLVRTSEELEHASVRQGGVGGARQQQAAGSKEEQQQQNDFMRMLTGGLGASISARIHALLPLFFFSGLNIGLIYGCLPALMPVLEVPTVYIVIAGAEVVGSVKQLPCCSFALSPTTLLARPPLAITMREVICGTRRQRCSVWPIRASNPRPTP